MKLRFFHCFVAVFLGFTAMAAPPMPENPSSEQAFASVKNFYHLSQGWPTMTVTGIESQTKGDGSLDLVHLQVPDYPEILLTIKKPQQSLKPMPAVILFTGFQTGAGAVNLVGSSDKAIYVGMQYPWPVGLTNGNLNWDWQRTEMIPALMAFAVKWLSQQPYVDANKINVVTVSFGTLMYPLAQRLLNEVGVYPHSIVFGYGGASVTEAIAHQLRTRMGNSELLVLKLLIQSQVWFVEPRPHLPYLRGPFLVVRAEGDTVFPESLAEPLIQGLAEPKKVVTVPGPHIQPDQPQLIGRFMEEVDQFLSETGGL